jgi:hypothetical protein
MSIASWLLSHWIICAGVGLSSSILPKMARAAFKKKPEVEAWFASDFPGKKLSARSFLSVRVWRSLVRRIEDHISALLVIVAFDELTSWIVNHDCFNWLTSCNLQQKVMNGLALSGPGIAQKHNVLGLICAWNRNPRGRFFKAKIVSKTGNNTKP